MEPIRLWRQERTDEGGVKYTRCVYSPHEGTSEWTTVELPMVAIPRADFDALVKRDQTCPLCGDELDPDEADYDSVCPPAGAGVCSQCFGRWYDAPLYEKRATAATARAEKAEARLARAEALLREARVWVHDGVMGRFTPRSCAETVIARIDALLAEAAGPTPDDRKGE